MGKIFVMIGKSATGKDTIYKRILAEESLSLCTVVGYTTRPRRTKEVEGVEYHFVDTDELAALQQAGKVIECRTYQTVHGPWQYFTVDDGQIDLSRSDYLMIETVEGYERFREYFGAEALVPLYVESPADIRLERSIKRERKQENPNYSEVCRRFLADEADFAPEKLAQAGIETCYENVELDDCVEAIIADIASIQKNTASPR